MNRPGRSNAPGRFFLTAPRGSVVRMANKKRPDKKKKTLFDTSFNFGASSGKKGKKPRKAQAFRSNAYTQAKYGY